MVQRRIGVLAVLVALSVLSGPMSGRLWAQSGNYPYGSTGGTYTGGTSGATNFEPARAFRPDDRGLWSSFGPGMFSTYDSRVYLFPGTTGGTSAVYYDAMRGRKVQMHDGMDGDPQDGTFAVVQERQAETLQLKNASGAVVSSLTSASTATLKVWGGLQQTFDVINLRPASSTPEYVGRLKSITDPNQHTLTIAYRDGLTEAAGGFSAQQLTDSPERRLQMYQITDWQGDIATFHYGATQQSGRWAVSSVVAPGNETIAYSYAGGLLTAVAAEGEIQSYTYGQDTVSQATTVEMPTCDGQKTVHLTNDYMTLIQGGTSTVVNQPPGVIRALINPVGESEFLMVPDPLQAGVARIYAGAGSAMEVTLGQSVRYYTDGWTAVAPGSTSMATGTYESTYSMTMNTTTPQLYTGAIPAVVDQQLHVPAGN